jgi:putative transcriptional regulator
MKNRLRELRTAKEWSQSDLADKLGVSRQTVNAIETERYDPSLPLAFKVARLFKLPIEEIHISLKARLGRMNRRRFDSRIVGAVGRKGG